jgi:hypothetical protein
MGSSRPRVSFYSHHQGKTLASLARLMILLTKAIAEGLHADMRNNDAAYERTFVQSSLNVNRGRS